MKNFTENFTHIKETVKTVLLTAFIAGTVSFVAGVNYQRTIPTANAATTTVTAPIAPIAPTSK